MPALEPECVNDEANRVSRRTPDWPVAGDPRPVVDAHRLSESNEQLAASDSMSWYAHLLEPSGSGSALARVSGDGIATLPFGTIMCRSLAGNQSRRRLGLAQSRCRCGRGGPCPVADVGRREPSPGADVAGVSPVPLQLWPGASPVLRCRCERGRVESRCRCERGRGEPSPSADVGGTSRVSVPSCLASARAYMRHGFSSSRGVG